MSSGDKGFEPMFLTHNISIQYHLIYKFVVLYPKDKATVRKDMNDNQQA